MRSAFRPASVATAAADPAHVSIRQEDAVFYLVRALISYCALHRLITRGTVVRMHALLEFSIANLTVSWKLKQLTYFVGNPESFRDGVEFPYAEMCRFGGKRDAFLELVQCFLLP